MSLPLVCGITTYWKSKKVSRLGFTSPQKRKNSIAYYMTYKADSIIKIVETAVTGQSKINFSTPKRTVAGIGKSYPYPYSRKKPSLPIRRIQLPKFAKPVDDGFRFYNY